MPFTPLRPARSMVMQALPYAMIAAAILFAAPAKAQDCAASQRPFDHLGGTTCIPDDPQRIVSLHDQQVTLPLLELDAPVVGSHGRLDDAGTPYMRPVDINMGLTFDNGGIAFVGAFDAMDYEAIAALEPDLIVGREWELEQRDRFEAIAPTVFIPNDAEEPMNFARGLADAVGRLEAWERMKAAYDANIARARVSLPEMEGATYAKIQADAEGTFTVYAGYGGLTQVLADLGMDRVPVAQRMADDGVIWGEDVSVETLPELQADYVFDTYTIAYGDVLADPAERLDGIFPAWCNVLTACAESRYIVLPREVASEFGFEQLNATIHLVTTHIARDLAP